MSSEVLTDINQKIQRLENNYIELLEETVRLRILVENKEKLRPIFLENTATKKTFLEKVDEIISLVVSNTSTKLNIMGYFDNDLVKLLLPRAKDVRILVKEEGMNTKAVRTASNRLLNAGAEIRSNEELHARIILTDKSVIIGSGDLEADSLRGNRIDACIWSDHPEIIESSKVFFEKIWNESKSVGETQILFSDFEKNQLNSPHGDQWKIYKEKGQIEVTNEVPLPSNSTRCLKISSPLGSSDFILYEFRECKKLKLEYKILQRSFNEEGIGACFHVFHTPLGNDPMNFKNIEAVHMAISKKQIYDYDNKHNFRHAMRINTWYNINVNIDCTTKSYNYTVNGKPYTGYFRNPLESVNAIMTTPWKDQPDWTTYFNHIKISKIE